MTNRIRRVALTACAALSLPLVACDRRASPSAPPFTSVPGAALIGSLKDDPSWQDAMSGGCHFRGTAGTLEGRLIYEAGNSSSPTLNVRGKNVELELSSQRIEGNRAVADIFSLGDIRIEIRIEELRSDGPLTEETIEIKAEQGAETVTVTGRGGCGV